MVFFNPTKKKRLSGFGRQERSPALQGVQLSVDDKGEAVHLHHADEARRRLEPGAGLSLLSSASSQNKLNPSTFLKLMPVPYNYDNGTAHLKKM